ncbi:MAG TPA: tyrosine-type recombinase/integrase [Terriglobales bacterium]|nr:tyrosine-type recombinase/integrase [Terriglobales bacterium]
MMSSMPWSASKIAGLKLAAAIEGSDPLDRKAPSLREFSKRFLEWLETARLEFQTQRYYRNGWRMLEPTAIAGMRMDRIKVDTVEALRFPGSAANANNALRTLRRMLHKAKEAKLIREVPGFKLFKDHGRAFRLDDEAERKLLPVAKQPLKDIIILMRDTGMRNDRELYQMRVENINWHERVIFNPSSKTEKGRRFIPISDRAMEILKARCTGRTEGWVFQSRYKGKHIGAAWVNRQWVEARRAAKLPEDLVLYCACHDFGSYVLSKTGNLKAVMDTIGHADVKIAMTYQHPELEIVRSALNSRHTLRHTGKPQMRKLLILFGCPPGIRTPIC